jgi:hypothetical protein
LTEADARAREKKSNRNEGCIIRGRVRYVRGPVPLATVTARLQPKATDTATDTTAEAQTTITTTDMTGTYRLTNLEPGTYEVTVTPPKDWNYQTTPQTLVLTPEEVKVADFTLEKAQPEAILEGRVLDGNGAPIKRAKLEGVICGNNLESSITDSEGRFIFKNVTPGARFVRVTSSGYVTELRDFTIDEGEKISIDISLNKAAHKIYGIITNEEGKPQEATVRLFQNRLVIQKWETTMEDGSYEFYVNEGEYSILVQAPFFRLSPWEGSVSEDKKLDFQLARTEQASHQEEDRSIG